MNDERIDQHLHDIDAAAGWFPEAAGWDGFPPSYDEWNAARLVVGDMAHSFTEYLDAIGSHAKPGDATADCPYCDRPLVHRDGRHVCDNCDAIWASAEIVNYARRVLAAYPFHPEDAK